MCGAAILPVRRRPQWLRLARLARALSWLTLGWLGIEAGVAIGAAVTAGSVALLGFGLDSGIEALASVIVIWRFTGTRLASPAAERRAQQLVAIGFYLLAPYVAAEAIWSLAAGDRAETSIAGMVLTAGTALAEPLLGVTKRRIGARLGSPPPPLKAPRTCSAATWPSPCSPGCSPTPCSAPGGSTAPSPWASPDGPSSKAAAPGPGEHAGAPVLQPAGRATPQLRYRAAQAPGNCGEPLSRCGAPEARCARLQRPR